MQGRVLAKVRVPGGDFGAKGAWSGGPFPQPVIELDSKRVVIVRLAIGTPGGFPEIELQWPRDWGRPNQQRSHLQVRQGK